MPKITKINHIAIAVDNLEQALDFWQTALGLQVSKTKDEHSERARVTFLPVGDSSVELVIPTDRDTGLARFLQNRGPGLHHICLEVDNLEEMLGRLKEHGVRMITPSPVPTEDGVRYVFIHPESTQGVLVELYQLSE